MTAVAPFSHVFNYKWKFASVFSTVFILADAVVVSSWTVKVLVVFLFLHLWSFTVKYFCLIAINLFPFASNLLKRAQRANFVRWLEKNRPYEMAAQVYCFYCFCGIKFPLVRLFKSHECRCLFLPLWTYSWMSRYHMRNPHWLSAENWTMLLKPSLPVEMFLVVHGN